MENKVVSICNRAIEYLFYALFFFVPLIFLPVTSELFEFNKMILTYAATALIGGFWAVKMALAGRFSIQRTPLDIPILLFLISQVISTILSIDVHTSIWGYYSRSNGGLLSIISYIFLYYAFVSNFKNTPEEINQPLSIKKKFLVPAIVMLILGFFGLIFYLNIDSLLSIFGEQLLRIMQLNAIIESIIISLLYLLAVVFRFIFNLFPLLQITPGMPEIITLSLITIFFLFLFSFRGSSIKRLFMMILISGAIVAFYGVLEHFGIDKDYWVQDVQNRVFSTLGQPNWLAAYLSILIPIAIVFGIQKTQNTQKASKSEKSDSLNFRSTDSLVHRVFRVFWIFLPLLFYLTLLYTKSRSGFVGLWIGLAFFVGTYFWHQRQTLKNITLKKFIGIYWYLLVVLVFIGSITFVVGAPFEQLKPFTLDGIGSKLSKQLATSNQQLVKAQGTALEIGGTESGEIRKIVWQGAIDIAKHYPLFGSGVETFAYSYYQYRPVEHNLTSEWDFLYNKAHNEYLNYLATTGAFGLGSYLLIIIVFLLLSTGKISNLKFTIFNENLKFKIKNYEDDFLSAILSFALITAYISILVSNFFGFSVVIINLFLFLIPAMVFVLNGQLHPQNALVFPNDNLKNGKSMKNFQWVLIILALAASGYLLVAIFRIWSADTDYALGKQYNRAGEYEQAYDYLVNASQKRPGEPLFADELAINTTALALTAIQKNQSTAAANFANEAVRQSSYAIKTSPNNPTFWRSRIRVFTALAQMDEKYYEDALLAAQKSTELSPTDPEIFYNYALILTQLGQVDEAIAQMKKAHNLKPDYREPIYALGIIYHEVASDENAIAQMEYIIKNIASDDAQAAEKLLEWRGY